MLVLLCAEGNIWIASALFSLLSWIFNVFNIKLISLEDPQYMTQALTNALLMDAVVGCLQTQRAITAASKLAYFDKIKHEGEDPTLMLWVF